MNALSGSRLRLKRSNKQGIAGAIFFYSLSPKPYFHDIESSETICIQRELKG